MSVKGNDDKNAKFQLTNTSRSNSSRSNSNNSVVLNHVCYLHSNAEIMCVSCVKKVVLEKKININVVRGNITDYKKRLNAILSKSINFKDAVIDPETDGSYLGEIKVLRTQAIQISKNHKTKRLLELQKLVKDAEVRNRKLKSQIESATLETSTHCSFSESISEKLKNQPSKQRKDLDFYQKHLYRGKSELLKELVALLDLQKIKSNNYFYICNKRLPLPKYLTKAMRINENSKIFNKQLFLLIEHLSKFVELAWIIYFGTLELELSKIILNNVFEENRENQENKILIIIVRKVSLVIFFLIKIELQKQQLEAKNDGVWINVNQMDYLGRLLGTSLADMVIKEEASPLGALISLNKGCLIKLETRDVDLMKIIKQQLLEQLL
ncbi:hypothetical protein QEN19_003981 [Hanseniaspora menglaensis]